MKMSMKVGCRWVTIIYFGAGSTRAENLVFAAVSPKCRLSQVDQKHNVQVSLRHFSFAVRLREMRSFPLLGFGLVSCRDRGLG